jgi:hypothetical protein
MLGLAYASLSALSLAIMISFDRIMVGDCYRNHPEQPWVISSLLGSAFGIIATSLVWITLSFTEIPSPVARSENEPAFINHFLSLASGVISSFVLRYYFRLFLPSKKGSVNETEIAVWLAFTPVFMFLLIAGLTFFIPEIPDVSELQTDSSWIFGSLVTLACLTLVLFIRFESDEPLEHSKRYGDIFLLVLLNTGYVFLSSIALSPFDQDLESVLKLLLSYWVGFAAGGLALLDGTTRSGFHLNARRLRKFSRIIILTEVVGMLVYFFEFLGVSEEDPTLVTLIIGAHVTVVFLLSLLLTQLRHTMIANGQRRFWLLGLRISANRLPLRKVTVGQVLRLIAVQISLLTVLGYAFF